MKLERGIIADVAATPPTPMLKKMCSQELEELAETMKKTERKTAWNKKVEIPEPG